MNTAKKLLLLLVTIVSVGGLFSGCRTAHGFGEDLENAGHSIQENTGGE